MLQALATASVDVCHKLSVNLFSYVKRLVWSHKRYWPVSNAKLSKRGRYQSRCWVDVILWPPLLTSRLWLSYYERSGLSVQPGWSAHTSSIDQWRAM